MRWAHLCFEVRCFLGNPVGTDISSLAIKLCSHVRLFLHDGWHVLDFRASWVHASGFSVASWGASWYVSERFAGQSDLS